MTTTAIEWADRVWNPVTGCTKVSQGCKHCYAEVMAKRTFGRLYPDVPVTPWAPSSTPPPFRPRIFTDVQTHADRLDAPLRWRKPARIFVNSMSDLFHEDVPDEFIERVLSVVHRRPEHTFMVLTKRPERMQAFMTRPISQWSYSAMPAAPSWPFSNLWLGVSVEDQATADQRIPLLLQTHASVRWVSAEPLLGPVTILREWLGLGHQHRGQADDDYVCCCGKPRAYHVGLDWVVVGGESGPKARDCDVAWIRSIVRQCQANRISVFVKQLGESQIGHLGDVSGPIGFVDALHHIGAFRKSRKGSDPSEWPEDIRVREFPAVAS